MKLHAMLGIAPEQVEAVYARVFPSLVSCLPELLDAAPGPLLNVNGGLCASYSLRFRSERDFATALFSMEWVELLDETADVFDWEETDFVSADFQAPRTELVAI